MNITKLRFGIEQSMVLGGDKGCDKGFLILPELHIGDESVSRAYLVMDRTLRKAVWSRKGKEGEIWLRRAWFSRDHGTAWNSIRLLICKDWQVCCCLRTLEGHDDFKDETLPAATSLTRHIIVIKSYMGLVAEPCDYAVLLLISIIWKTIPCGRIKAVCSPPDSQPALAIAGPNLLPVDVELREEGGSLSFNPCSLQLVRRHLFRSTTSTGYNTSIVWLPR